MKVWVVLWHHNYGTDTWTCSTSKKATQMADELSKEVESPDDFIEILETKLDGR